MTKTTKKVSRKELIEMLRKTCNLIAGNTDDDGSTIYQTRNPYSRPTMKQALEILSIVDKKDDKYDVKLHD